jgi:hypothetical protein
MDVIRKIQLGYAKLGMKTDPDLIASRGEILEEIVAELQHEEIPNLVRCALSLKVKETELPWLGKFNEKDPEHEIQPNDAEASLLASAVAAHALQSDDDVKGALALAMVTASFRGMRTSLLGAEMLTLSNQVLADQQSISGSPPGNRTVVKQGKTITDVVQVLKQAGHFQPGHGPQITSALEAIGLYAETSQNRAAASDNELLGYIRKLEQELRIYWWATSGWSFDVDGPIAELPLLEAVIRAGAELADKDGSEFGLFAAPALLSMVVGREKLKAAEQDNLGHVAVASDRQWRTDKFSGIATGKLGDLLPVTAALGLAADSEDQSDWTKRFERLCGFDASKACMSPADMALQLYREMIFSRVASE